MYRLSYQQQGIALIQVLFLSAILSIMLLSVIYQSQQHIRTAERYIQRAEAALKLNAMEAETMFALLTQPKLVKPDSSIDMARVWNFHNSPFSLHGDIFQIQDLSGLGSVFHLELVAYLLTEEGLSADNRTILEQDLKHAISNSGALPAYLKGQGEFAIYASQRFTPIQLVEELQFYPGVSAVMIERLKPLLTAYPIPQYNYLTMPEQILAYYLQPLELSAVLDARDKGLLTGQLFTEITGKSYDLVYGTTVGRGLRLRFTALTKDVKLRRQADVVLDPYSAEPVKYWEYHKYRHVQ